MKKLNFEIIKINIVEAREELEGIEAQIESGEMETTPEISFDLSEALEISLGYLLWEQSVPAAKPISETFSRLDSAARSGGPAIRNGLRLRRS